MVMLGCKPEGRLTEQHDIFFGIAPSLKALIPEMKAFWPEAKGQIHIDAWREITQIDGHSISIVKRKDNQQKASPAKRLFFINLGGYKRGEFEEYHYKVVTVADTRSKAIKTSMNTSFYKHCGFEGATSHIDDKYGIDVDDIYEIEDILNEETKSEYAIEITPSKGEQEDDLLHIGYLKLALLEKRP